jgi:hypothetical protein
MEGIKMEELLTLEELNDLAEISVDDITGASYEVWAIGYDEDGVIIPSAEALLLRTGDPDAAAIFAEHLTIGDIIHLTYSDCADTSENADHNHAVAYLSIEVETAISQDGNFADLSYAGTIYKRKIPFVAQPDIVLENSTQYEPTEDGIKISKKAFSEFKKDAVLDIAFSVPDVISYKMLSEDDNWIYCEFIG